MVFMSFSKGEMFCFDDKFLRSSRPSTRQAFQTLQLGVIMPVTLLRLLRYWILE